MMGGNGNWKTEYWRRSVIQKCEYMLLVFKISMAETFLSGMFRWHPEGIEKGYTEPYMLPGSASIVEGLV